MSIFGILIFALICGSISEAIGNNKNLPNQFWWGFLLGIAGIIVVALRPYPPKN